MFDRRMKPILIALLLAFVPQSFAALIIKTVAGCGTPGFSGDGGPAEKAELNNPYGLTIGPEGSLFICDMGNHRIRKIDSHGTITTVAGSGEKGWRGDGGRATEAALNEPYEVRFDRNGNMYFVEMQNHVVRRVDILCEITTFAGTGKAGFAGDGGPATSAMLKQPHSIQFVGNELWICDIGNHRIRSVDLLDGTIKTVGGTGEQKETRNRELLEYTPLNGPRVLDVDTVGNVWLALREGNRIYRIDRRSSFKVWRAAGTGGQGFSVASQPALEAPLAGPKGITVAQNGWVIFADTESHSVRYLDPKKNTVELLAGTGKKGDGKDGDALACELSRPHGVFADAVGSVWISDSENHRVRRVRLH